MLDAEPPLADRSEGTALTEGTSVLESLKNDVR